MDSDLIPFRVAVPDEDLEDLRLRLDRTRWPDEVPGSGWGNGSDLGYVRSLCDTWRHEFDWRRIEARINAWPQFTTVIDGQRIHFLWARSGEPGALPLLVTHGWPGSVVEFLDVIEPLRDPVRHGGSSGDAFDVVVPSLPGYGWSGPTGAPGWDIARVARAWRELMTRLGYDRFGAQGGDWGSMITVRMALQDPDPLVGIHLNMALAKPTDGEVTPQEAEDLEDARRFMRHGTAYHAVQGRNPQTLAYGLTDSPAGLAGWLAEKFRDWTDNDGDPDEALTRDQVLSNLSVYWFTRTIGSSIRLYAESQRSGNFGAHDGYVEVPTGVAVFPREIFRFPRSWVAAGFNLVHHRRYDRGGHFAAFEEPDLFVSDVREFFRHCR